MNDPFIDMSVRVVGLDALLRKLGSMGPQVYRPAVAEGATHIKRVIATYPPQKPGRKQPPKTARQRRYLMWAIRNGVIDVPYRRGISPGSEAMGRRWSIAFRDSGKTAIVGDNASYVQVVQGHADQSHFHAVGGWKTDRQVAEQESRPVQRIFARHIAQWNRGS